MARVTWWSLTALLLLWTGALFVQPTGGPPFDSLDRDKDGKLSREEHPEPIRTAFDAIDTDRDGAISCEEHDATPPAAWRRRHGAFPRVSPSSATSPTSAPITPA